MCLHGTISQIFNLIFSIGLLRADAPGLHNVCVVIFLLNGLVYHIFFLLVQGSVVFIIAKMYIVKDLYLSTRTNNQEYFISLSNSKARNKIQLL